MHTIIILILLIFTNSIYGQSEQAGIDLAASFPQITQGNIEPDLPADGFYWDVHKPGWGVAVEVQSQVNTPSGYFLFGAGYFYREDGSQFWCAFSEPYEPNPDVHQWRDHKDFSNLPNGHSELPVMADQIAHCHVMQGGPALISGIHRENYSDEIIKLRMVWRNPSELEITPEGGTTHYTVKMGFRDNLQNPTLDWIMDYNWSIKSSLAIYGNDSNDDPNTTKIIFNFNFNTGFETLDIENHPDVKDFVGHKTSNAYYISTIKKSSKSVSYFNQSNSLVGVFEPYTVGGISNEQWVVLVHDIERKNVSLYTVAGEKTPDDLRPDAGIDIKLVAKVVPDADVLDFYPKMCEGDNYRCDRTARTYRNSDMANWSPQNVHRSSLKMFKFRTGGEAYFFQPNTGESNSQAMNRIKQMLIDQGYFDM